MEDIQKKLENELGLFKATQKGNPTESSFFKYST